MNYFIFIIINVKEEECEKVLIISKDVAYEFFQNLEYKNYILYNMNLIFQN